MIKLMIISTLNLCLGLKHKMLEIEQLLIENKIDVLCLQEMEVEIFFDSNLLAINGYRLELENNSEKARTGFYIRNSEISRKDLI